MNSKLLESIGLGNLDIAYIFIFMQKMVKKQHSYLENVQLLLYLYHLSAVFHAYIKY